MKMYVGITDYDWYQLLKQQECDEVNFWKPGEKVGFGALNQNELFLFKLHSPRDYIVGGGFFVRFSSLPTYVAWEAFGIKNGTKNLEELNLRVKKYRNNFGSKSLSLNIGCIILTQPFFFEEHDWIPAPMDWKSSIVQGKSYNTENEAGKELYEKVVMAMRRTAMDESEYHGKQSIGSQPKFTEGVVRHRLGQGAFRVSVLEAYNRRCAITGEKTLPVLEAAHIKPYTQQGEHETCNGLSLRKDIHTLFDQGYMTIDADYRVNVSKRLNEDFGNGKIYYDLHGKPLFVIPKEEDDLPSRKHLSWHNEFVYLG